MLRYQTAHLQLTAHADRSEETANLPLSGVWSCCRPSKSLSPSSTIPPASRSTRALLLHAMRPPVLSQRCPAQAPSDGSPSIYQSEKISSKVVFSLCEKEAEMRPGSALCELHKVGRCLRIPYGGRFLRRWRAATREGRVGCLECPTDPGGKHMSE